MTVISRNMSDSEYICTAHVLQGNFLSEITISSLENPDFKQKISTMVVFRSYLTPILV